eukprot:GHVU01066715.1.p1 GENE.GHVU01066715.1~~GHVU01066715.1.p1  ORF type:complete len:462 (+),score=56.68 GHVU01066715.1:182-1387(+)
MASNTPQTAPKSNWAEAELIALCRAWLAETENRSTGNQQRKSKFWEEIKKRCNTQRTLSALEHKFGDVGHSVSRFCGCVDQETARNLSGADADINLQNAHERYLNKYGVKFSLKACYDVLGDSPRFRQYAAAKAPPPSESSRGKRPRSQTAPNESTPGAAVHPAHDAEAPGGCKKKKFEDRLENMQAQTLRAHTKMTESVEGTSNARLHIMYKSMLVQAATSTLPSPTSYDILREVKKEGLQYFKTGCLPDFPIPSRNPAAAVIPASDPSTPPKTTKSTAESSTGPTAAASADQFSLADSDGAEHTPIVDISAHDSEGEREWQSQRAAEWPHVEEWRRDAESVRSAESQRVTYSSSDYALPSSSSSTSPRVAAASARTITDDDIHDSFARLVERSVSASWI